jgi:hypothetical protein
MTAHSKKVEWYLLLDQKSGERITMYKGIVIPFFKNEEKAWEFLYTKVPQEMREGLRPVKVDVTLPIGDEPVTYKEERVIDL